MTNSSNNSKPKASQTTSPEATLKADIPAKITPMGLLLDELRDAVPTAPISVRQARVLAANIVNLQKVLVTVLDDMARMQEISNVNADNTSQNFIGMLSAIKQLCAAIGVEIHGINADADADSELPPPGTVKH